MLMTCWQDIPAGEQLIRVPLRLAITDAMGEEQKKSIVGEVCNKACTYFKYLHAGAIQDLVIDDLR